MKDAHVNLNSGRQLAFADFGDPHGACLLFFHGAPMSRLHLVGLEEQFAAAGLRIVAPDRPGYGRSSPQPRRSISDWPDDVAELADHLGIEHFMVAAHSSGGPYAVACTALLQERVSAAVILAGVTDMGWPGALAGYPEDEIQMMRADDEEAAVAWGVARYGADGNGFLSAEPFAFPEPDLAVLKDASFGQAVVEAFRMGVSAYAQDVYVQGRAWPFNPQRITAPVVVVHGELDTFIPVAHSRHTAGLIPGSTLRILPGHGHLSIASELPAMASELNAALESVPQQNTRSR